MKFVISKESIKIEKDLSDIDKFTLEFIEILNQFKIGYALISGYVAILFGRSRLSEDVDLFIERLSEEKFLLLWEKLADKFECINTGNNKEAYEYLTTGHALRFSKKDKFIPNMEIKFPKKDIDFWALENKKKVIFNNKIIYVGPIELQIAFKLFMGSEKDLEDAKHIYNMFKKELNISQFFRFLHKFNIEEIFNKHLK